MIRHLVSTAVFIGITAILTSCSRSPEDMINKGKFKEAMKIAKEDNDKSAYWRSFSFASTLDSQVFEKLRNVPEKDIPPNYRNLVKGALKFAQMEYKTSSTQLLLAFKELKPELTKHEIALLTSMIGISFMHSGNYTNAQKYLSESLETEKTPEIQYYLAYLLYIKGNYDDALKVLTDIETSDKFITSSALFLKGKIAYRKADYASAEILFKKSIEIIPNFAEAMFWLGKTYEKRHFENLARRWWRLTLRNDPNHGGAWFKLNY